MVEHYSEDISAEELMAKIEQKVVAGRASDFDRNIMTDHAERNRKSSFDWAQINSNLDVAENHADVGTKMLPLLRFGRSIRWVAKLVGHLILYVSKIITIPQMHFNRSLLQTVRNLRNGLQHLDNHLLERDQWVNDKFSDINGKFSDINGKFSDIDNYFQELDQRHVWTKEKFDQELDQRHVWTKEKFDEFQNQAVIINRRLSELENRLAGATNFIDEHNKNISYLRRDTVIQERRLGVLLEEAKKRLPEPFDKDQLETFLREETHILDPLYISFEDRFRGTRADIKLKLTEYLPMVREAEAGSIDRPILDIGCGRGEWLELLNEENLVASGLDLNRILVEENIQRSLEVIEGDVIEYLKTLPNDCLGAVTGFHLVEHLPFNILIKLFDETVRVLKPGGVAIFETPNPENILVGACHFYADPTHKNPIPSYVLKFIAEYRGMYNIKILKLHPFPDDLKLSGSELAERFNEYFYGPRDYAVIGYKV